MTSRKVRQRRIGAIISTAAVVSLTAACATSATDSAPAASSAPAATAAASSAASAASSAAASGSAQACAPGDDLTVGLLTPMTGFAANYGPEAAAGLQQALDEAGSTAGGRKITVITADEDVTDPSQTLERLKQMVESDGADVIVGPIFGSTQQAVAAYLKQQNVPMFTMLGGGENLAGEGTGFLWPAADNRTAAPLGTYAAEDLGYKKIATLAPDYAYGHDAIDGITKAFEAAGGTVAQQQWVPLGTTDMLQYATKLDQSVDALAMWLVPSDAAAFIKEYRNLGIKVPLLLFQGIFDPTYQEMGDQVQGEIGLNEYNHLLDNPANAAFTEAYAAANDGAIPNQTTAFAYQVGRNIVTALDADCGDATTQGLRTALADLPLDTVIGAAHYNADGMAVSNRVVVKATKGADGRYEWEPVKTYENVG